MEPVVVGSLIAAGASILGGWLSSKSAPKAPKMPKDLTVEKMIDVIDYVSGVSVTHVRGPGGHPQKVISNLPKTKEEQELYDTVGDIMRSFFENIQSLNKEDPMSLMDYTPFLTTINKLNQERGKDIEELTKIANFEELAQDFKKMEQESIQEQFNSIKNASRSELAQLGYGLDSTAWSNRSAAIDAEKAKALRGLDVRSKLAGQDLAEKEVRNRILNYHLNEEARAAQRQAELDTLGMQHQKLSEREAHRQKLIAEQAGLFESASAVLKGEKAQTQGSSASSLSATLASQQLAALQMDSQNRLTDYRNKPYSFGEIAGIGLTSLGGHMLSNPSRFNEGTYNILNDKNKGEESKTNQYKYPQPWDNLYNPPDWWRK